MLPLALNIFLVWLIQLVKASEPLSNATIELPLRVPPVLLDFYHEKQEHQRPKRSEGGAREGKQLVPGVYSCGHQGSEMFVNFINPHYPGDDTAAGTCHFRLLKNSPDICQVRVDFVDTEMLTPDNGLCNEQYLLVSGTIWPLGFQRLCGINPDNHFYVHLTDVGNFEHVDFAVTTVHSNKPYKFGLWLTQISCKEETAVKAPGGCTQYHFGTEGVIKSFNFEGVQYIAAQNYKICIRSEPGSCFIGYAADTNHFMLQLHPTYENRNFRSSSSSSRTSGRPPSGQGDQDCTFDWLLIPGARGNLTKFGQSTDRFCGGQLNSDSDQEESIPLYAEITSQIIWLQLVTGSRDPFAMQELEIRSTHRTSATTATSMNYRNPLNEGFDGTGPGIRLRYAQLRNCIDISPFIAA